MDMGVWERVSVCVCVCAIEFDLALHPLGVSGMLGGWEHGSMRTWECVNV